MNKSEIFIVSINNNIYVLKIGIGKCGECILYSDKNSLINCRINDGEFFFLCELLEKRLGGINIIINKSYKNCLFICSYARKIKNSLYSSESGWEGPHNYII